MTTTAIEAHLAEAETSRRSWTSWLAPTGGIGLVAGLIGIFLSPAGDDTGETPAQVVAYAASHQRWTEAIAIFGMLAVLLGALFVAGLYARIRSFATPLESMLVLIGGTVFTLCFMLALTTWTAPLMDMPSDPARALRAAETYLAIDDIGWFMLGAGGVAAATMAVPASLAALRARAVPAWLGWLGVAAGVVSLATVIGIGMFAWMAWIVGASAVLAAAKR